MKYLPERYTVLVHRIARGPPIDLCMGVSYSLSYKQNEKNLARILERYHLDPGSSEHEVKDVIDRAEGGDRDILRLVYDIIER